MAELLLQWGFKRKWIWGGSGRNGYGAEELWHDFLLM
jgi:hypothetical protein